MAVRTGKDRASVAKFFFALVAPALPRYRLASGQGAQLGHARTLLAFEHPEEIEKGL